MEIKLDLEIRILHLHHVLLYLHLHHVLLYLHLHHVLLYLHLHLHHRTCHHHHLVHRRTSPKMLRLHVWIAPEEKMTVIESMDTLIHVEIVVARVITPLEIVVILVHIVVARTIIDIKLSIEVLYIFVCFINFFMSSFVQSLKDSKRRLAQKVRVAAGIYYSYELYIKVFRFLDLMKILIINMIDLFVYPKIY
jgi:hypothetical protein